MTCIGKQSIAKNMKAFKTPTAFILSVINSQGNSDLSFIILRFSSSSPLFHTCTVVIYSEYELLIQSYIPGNSWIKIHIVWKRYCAILSP